MKSPRHFQYHLRLSKKERYLPNIEQNCITLYNETATWPHVCQMGPLITLFNFFE